MVEESISRAYVKLIRTAERFIYIENQYFLGSAYAWHTDSEVRLHFHLSLSLSPPGAVPSHDPSRNRGKGFREDS